MATPLQVEARLRAPVTAQDHVRGPQDAPVTLVEYGDFQCRFCAEAHRNLTDVLDQRAETVRLIFRHFPVVNVHPYAEQAAVVAEAAARRGRFWPLHDWLFEHQDQLDAVHLSLGVEQLGLPVGEVDDEVSRELHDDRVRRDFVGGIRSGVRAVPALFVNGAPHEGDYDLPTLLSAVDHAAST
ncbi:DsbA family protein [Micromonospora sp. NPDC000207]|uniref:DsbA family protein n=1 Tax=Micromonospora sp. NPDC000207 TaxID=3154246 RepID=UPI00332C5F83